MHVSLSVGNGNSDCRVSRDRGACVECVCVVCGRVCMCATYSERPEQVKCGRLEKTLAIRIVYFKTLVRSPQNMHLDLHSPLHIAHSGTWATSRLFTAHW